MKKFLSLLLTLSLTLSLTVTALAVTITQPEDQTADILVKHERNYNEWPIYSVDITWGSLKFTCTASGEKVWNSTKHTYDDETTYIWKADNDHADKISLANHSNVPVLVKMAFAAAEGYNNLSASLGIADEGVSVGRGIENEPTNPGTLMATLKIDENSRLSDTGDDFVKIGTVTITINDAPIE